MAKVKVYEGLKPEQYQHKFIVASVKTDKGNFSSRKVYANNELDKDTMLYVGDLEIDERLAVEMPYVGKGASNANSQGWLRDNKYYTKELYKSYPEAFSEENVKRVEEGRQLQVDRQLSSVFTAYEGFEGQFLVHHHIGGDGQAAAVPASLHIGSGGIQNQEEEAGITENGEKYTNFYEEWCSVYPSADRAEINHAYTEKIRSEQAVDQMLDGLYRQLNVSGGWDPGYAQTQSQHQAKAESQQSGGTIVEGFDDGLTGGLDGEDHTYSTDNTGSVDTLGDSGGNAGSNRSGGGQDGSEGIGD